MPNIQDTEYERRFLVDVFPDDKVVEKLDIIQEYYPSFTIASERHGTLRSINGDIVVINFPRPVPPGIKVKLRQRFSNNQQTFTLKGPKLNGIGYEQEWTSNTPLKASSFSDVVTLKKVRHIIPYGEMVIEVDVFDIKDFPLIIAEIENPAEAFTAPDWFGREITDDENYSNWSLANKK